MLNLIFSLLSVFAFILFFAELIGCITNYVDCNKYTDDSNGWLSKKFKIYEEKDFLIQKGAYSLCVAITSALSILLFLFHLNISKYVIVVFSIVTLVALHETYPVVLKMYNKILKYRKESKFYTDFTGLDYDFYIKSKQDRRYYLYGLVYCIVNIFYVMIWI